MSIERSRFNDLVKNFDFKNLFNELGWEGVRKTQPIEVDEETFTLNAVAEKRGFVIFECNSNSSGTIPNKDIRKKLERKLTKLYYEHLLIFVDDNKTRQIWQTSIKEANKPIVVREVPYSINQEPELLFQKLQGLLFTLDEEEKIGLVDVKQRVSEQFNQNAETVTKAFYNRFKTEHNKFQDFIEGIEDAIDKDWYTSLMLNRLMFIYFIQKKGFLNGNPNYLKEKLDESKVRKGKDKFYSFYRNFLLVLFHEGLGKPDHSKKMIEEIGKIPYLNGGLFDVHRIEETYENINIPDDAFENLFNFFDEYNWHLDTRVTSTGRDINPDVIGYIFEKYINDRAAMGAYYTKEDITEYISKNTIIPYLFDQVKQNCANAFKEDSSIWQLLRDDPDRYIYESIRKGIYKETVDENGNIELEFNELPEEIKDGLDTSRPNLIEMRKAWNKYAPEEYALPTEIWREVVERRERYFELKRKLENDEIRDINNFITYNLNITQFAQDALQYYEGSDFVNAFYKAITNITVLDPTCGSGAFLFAALNILEPLYEKCIDRMREFVEQADEKGHSQKHKNFRKVLEEIEKHPNEKYYIFKNIILNNLYGVDIMNEAVEVAKLRLFLKLVAEVKPDEGKENYGLEPLPDIDFNIRAGNTLVGFTSIHEIKNAFEESESNGRLIFGEERKIIRKIEDEANIVSDFFDEFKKKQTIIESTSKELKDTKNEVIKRLQSLNELLNKYLAYTYGINTDDLVEQNRFHKWLNMHKPFHWFAEFYEILQKKGGFDVLIGNPPYIEYRDVKYSLKNYKTKTSGAIHAICVEKAISLMKNTSSFSMILPMSIVSTKRMKVVQEIAEADHSCWYSNFAWRPSKLFDSVNRALTILVINPTATNRTRTTNYQKWTAKTRSILFEGIKYSEVNRKRNKYWVPKFYKNLETEILNKIESKTVTLENYLGNSGYHIYYRTTGGLYWKLFTNFRPKFYLNNKEYHSSREASINLIDSYYVLPFISILSSNTFWWFYTISSNLRDLNPSDLYNLKIDEKLLFDERLQNLGEVYLENLKQNSYLQERNQKQTGNTKTQTFIISKSKHIIDEIDKIISEYYEFEEEELDFIINYDIKYRMGKELEET